MVHEGAVDTDELRKARGAFFTPEPLARYIADWALRAANDRVLEPSCGEAEFLVAAGRRLASLNLTAGSEGRGRLAGVEMHDHSARQATLRLRSLGFEAQIQTADFFQVHPDGQYDAVIGNPPYVRYQDFSGESRARSREAALRAGVALTNLASSWAAFTVHSALFLRRGGRLGLVLPAELLTVNYASAVRRFLMERFARVDLVHFTERVFPDALEEVVLLLADGYEQGPTDHCRIFQANNASDLAHHGLGRIWKPDAVEGKWTTTLLSDAALNAYTEVTHGRGFTTLSTWGDTTLGMVTGNNRYFALSPERVRELRIPADDLVPLSPPGSRHLRGFTFTSAAAKELGAAGSATWLFRPPGEPAPASRRYIAAGESTGVQRAYKCRVREPWWRVPLIEPSHLLLTYMNADTPRLCTNRARVHHLNSVHGVYLRSGLVQLGMDLLPIAALNSMTLLGAETVGRAYGGGMLKLEPREADSLPVPAPEVLRSTRAALSNIRPQMGALLRAGRLLDAARLVDDIVLVGELGVPRSVVKSLREGHSEMTARRVARGGAVTRVAH